jgi:hypothetical protein
MTFPLSGSLGTFTLENTPMLGAPKKKKPPKGLLFDFLRD